MADWPVPTWINVPCYRRAETSPQECPVIETVSATVMISGLSQFSVV